MMTRNVAALIVGTRPEAIKLAPVYRALESAGRLAPVLVSTGQHRELLDATLAALELRADQNLALMVGDQTPNEISARVFERLPQILTELEPRVVVVQGDTTTVLAAALVAFHLGIPVAHVEAGLRTGDLGDPFPEEANRQLVDRVSHWCFAPTAAAAANLAAEGIAPERVLVTGNTAVDSLLWALPRSSTRLDVPTLLVTLHRRESFGGALDEILLGVRDFLDATPDARALWPVHPNPNVQSAAARVLAGAPRITRSAPMGYVDFAGALATCRVVLTDSGGIQEEAPSLGKTVVVARDVTERPEALAGGRMLVAGRTRRSIHDALVRAWAAPAFTAPVPAPNPYGDGHAGERIAEALANVVAAT